MLLKSFYFTVSLYILSELDSARCYTYQTKPLFMSFSDLAELERNSLDRTNKPNSLFGDQEVKSFEVKCHEDSVEVVMKAYLFDPNLPVTPDHLRLGPAGAGLHHCAAKASENGEFIIRAPLTDCGGEVMFTHSAVLYKNLLLFSPPLTSPGHTLHPGRAAVSIQCEYKRRYTVSSGALKPTWSPLISVHSRHLDLDFHLRLMTDDWSRERKSFVYFLGETVNIKASVYHHLPLRLYAHSCVATLTSDVNSYPRYPFIDHQGCFTDSQLQGSSSRFLPRVQDHQLQIRLQTFRFHQDHRHTVYITCYLEAEPISHRKPVKRACSFIDGRWRSADGDDQICASCSSSGKSNHKRALKSETKRRQTELHKETSLGPIIFLSAARKHKYLH